MLLEHVCPCLVPTGSDGKAQGGTQAGVSHLQPRLEASSPSPPPPCPLQLRGWGEGLTQSLRTSHQLWLVLPGLACPVCPAYRGLPWSVTVGGQGRGCHSLPRGPVALGPRDRGPSAVAGLGHDWPSPCPCPQVKDGAGHFSGCQSQVHGMGTTGFYFALKLQRKLPL